MTSKAHQVGSNLWWTLLRTSFQLAVNVSCSSFTQLKMGPGTAIVITDITIVKDLMDKRSQSTIDRPPNHLADRVAGGMNMVLARYSKPHFPYSTFRF